MLIKIRGHADGPTMDMTPLIDTVFNLLIFFLVASSFQQIEHQMQIALPFAKSAGPISTTFRELVVNVDAEGAIILAGQRVSAADLQDVVKDAVAENPQQKVTVRGDRRAAYGHVVRALDACKSGGVQEPYLDTVLE